MHCTGLTRSGSTVSQVLINAIIYHRIQATNIPGGEGISRLSGEDMRASFIGIVCLKRFLSSFYDFLQGERAHS